MSNTPYLDAWIEKNAGLLNAAPDWLMPAAAGAAGLTTLGGMAKYKSESKKNPGLLGRLEDPLGRETGMAAGAGTAALGAGALGGILGGKKIMKGLKGIGGSGLGKSVGKLWDTGASALRGGSPSMDAATSRGAQQILNI